jgi:hypothetical protein
MGDDGVPVFDHVQTHRRTVDSENEAFFLRISKEGDYKYEGADLGILLTPGRLMTDDHQLNDRARAWIKGMRGLYHSRPVPEDRPEPPVAPGDFKIM